MLRIVTNVFLGNPLMSALQAVLQIKQQINEQIIGQQDLVNRLFIALLADGHLLVEGAPGLAKTKAIASLAQAISCQFHRVQFTPDLLPSDITGSESIGHKPKNSAFIRGRCLANYY